MTKEIPLQLRSVEVVARVAVELCGQACLLGTEDAFSYAIPGGMSLMTENSEGVIRGVLFGTRRGTLIKPKAVGKPSFGWNEHFSEESHRQALDMLRESTFDGVCRPQRECPCSLEFRKVDGRIAWVPFSMHAARLAELFPVHPLHTRSEAVEFIHAAWRVLSDLNRMGISHGDPSFYNFVVGDRTVLIDLDQCAYLDERQSAWDQNVFLHSTIVPVMAGFMPAEEIAMFAGTVMADAILWRSGGAKALAAGIFYTMEYNSCAKQLRSLAMRHHALGIQATETGIKLTNRLREEQARHRSMLSIAEERGQELERATAEANALRATAEERLNEMHRKDAATAGLGAKLELRNAELERAAAEANALRATADERLNEMQLKEAVIQELLSKAKRQSEQLTRDRDELAQRIQGFEAESLVAYLRRRWKKK